MEELKITIFTKNKNGETKTIHTKWDKNDPSIELDTLHEELIALIREANLAISKKKSYEVDR